MLFDSVFRLLFLVAVVAFGFVYYSTFFPLKCVIVVSLSLFYSSSVKIVEPKSTVENLFIYSLRDLFDSMKWIMEMSCNHILFCSASSHSFYIHPKLFVQSNSLEMLPIASSFLSVQTIPFIQNVDECRESNKHTHSY